MKKISIQNILNIIFAIQANITDTKIHHENHDTDASNLSV